MYCLPVAIKITELHQLKISAVRCVSRQVVGVSVRACACVCLDPLEDTFSFETGSVTESGSSPVSWTGLAATSRIPGVRFACMAMPCLCVFNVVAGALNSGLQACMAPLLALKLSNSPERFQPVPDGPQQVCVAFSPVLGSRLQVTPIVTHVCHLTGSLSMLRKAGSTGQAQSSLHKPWSS